MPHLQEKIHENILHTGQLQKKIREYRDFRFDLKSYKDLNGTSLHFRKQEKSFLKAQVQKEKKKIAQEHFEGNGHAVMLTQLKQETQETEELLSKVTSDQLVKVRGKKIPLHEFAAKQAFGLSLCATKSVYQFNMKNKKFKFKHSLRCGRRTCSVCSHFQSVEEGKQIMGEIENLLSKTSKQDLKNGRLYHIVLTHENVPVEQVFDIFKAWRHTQMMKKKEYKKKQNPYDVWNVLKWGLWRWEVTRNEETGLYHPHLHIIAFVNGWLAPEAGGYWDRLVNSWIAACANAGVKAEWEGQHFAPILYFKEKPDVDPRCLPIEYTEKELQEALNDAVAEMAKYAVKSTDFTKIKKVKEGENLEDIANELALLFALMAGRKIKNGFGGFSLREEEEPEEPIIQEAEPEEEEQENPEDLMEAIFTWDKRERRYKLYAFRKWDEQRFSDYIQDMQNYKERHALTMYYGLERD